MLDAGHTNDAGHGEGQRSVVSGSQRCKGYIRWRKIGEELKLGRGGQQVKSVPLVGRGQVAAVINTKDARFEVAGRQKFSIRGADDSPHEVVRVYPAACPPTGIRQDDLMRV